MLTRPHPPGVHPPAIAPMGVFEVAHGNPFGEIDHGPPAPDRVRTPAAELREIIVAALSRQPCVVSLTPEDESLRLLQTAMAVAREEGLPLPLAGWVEPEEGPAREDLRRAALAQGVQELAVARAPLEDLGLLGEPALSFLRDHGLPFPASVGFVDALTRAASGGSLLMAQNASQLWRFWRGRVLAAGFHGVAPG